MAYWNGYKRLPGGNFERYIKLYAESQPFLQKICYFLNVGDWYDRRGGLSNDGEHSGYGEDGTCAEEKNKSDALQA